MKLESAPHSGAPLIRAYMPELDSVRGIAILLVVLFHGMVPPLKAEVSALGRGIFGLSQYGWTGVNLFFVLSGFLITGNLLDCRQRPDYFRRFYLRRALRILPALFGMLLLLLAGGWISFRFAAISVLFLANFAGVLGVGAGYGALWSLAVEEHFYMLWPLLVRRWSARGLIILAAVVSVGSPFLRILTLVGGPVPLHLAALYTWFNLDGLALGSLLAVWVRIPSFRRHQLARIALPIFIMSTAVFFLLVGRSWADATVVKSACNLASAGLLSCMLLVGASKWSFLVDRPILKFFGFISYGLYLVHILAFHISEVLLSHPLSVLVANGKPLSASLIHFGSGLALGTAVAYLSRRSLEERFLRIGHDSSRKSFSSPVSQATPQSVEPPVQMHS